MEDFFRGEYTDGEDNIYDRVYRVREWLQEAPDSKLKQALAVLLEYIKEVDDKTIALGAP